MQKLIRRPQIFLGAAVCGMVSAVVAVLTYVQTVMMAPVAPSNTTYVYAPTVQSLQPQPAPAPQEASPVAGPIVYSEPVESPPPQPIEALSSRQTYPSTGAGQSDRLRTRPSRENAPPQHYVAPAVRSGPEQRPSPDEYREPAGLVFRHVAR